MASTIEVAHIDTVDVRDVDRVDIVDRRDDDLDLSIVRLPRVSSRDGGILPTLVVVSPPSTAASAPSTAATPTTSTTTSATNNRLGREHAAVYEVPATHDFNRPDADEIPGCCGRLFDCRRCFEPSTDAKWRRQYARGRRVTFRCGNWQQTFYAGDAYKRVLVGVGATTLIIELAAIALLIYVLVFVIDKVTAIDAVVKSVATTVPLITDAVGMIDTAVPMLLNTTRDVVAIVPEMRDALVALGTSLHSLDSIDFSGISSRVDTIQATLEQLVTQIAACGCGAR